VLLVVKVNALPLDFLELVILYTKSVNIGYNAGVPKVAKSIINNKTTGAAGIKDGVVGILDTRMMKIRGGECLCMKGGTIGGLAFTLCPLVGYSIIDIEVADVLGNSWSMVRANKDEWVVTGVGRVEVHPLTAWVVSVLHVLHLSGGVGNLCWGGNMVKKGRW